MPAIPTPTMRTMAMAANPDPVEWCSRIWRQRMGVSREPALEELLVMFRTEVTRSPGIRARLHRPIGSPKQVMVLPHRQLSGDVDYVFSAGQHRSYTRTADTIGLADLVFAHPRRDFSRRRHQRHKPVAQFVDTVGDLVMCESRLERSFVLLADFTPSVAHVVSQPFTMLYPKGASFRHHTPDFCVLGHGRPPLIVDVKRPEQAAIPKILERHLTVARTLAEIGVGYTVWTGVPETVTVNLGNFAAASLPLRPDRARALAATVRALAASPIQAGDLATQLEERDRVPRVVGLAIIRSFIWSHVLRTPLTELYTPESLVSC
jgi:hypothetical protein